MYQVKKVTTDMYWIGGNDRRLALFENVIPIPRGISYNSYFVDDEKTVLLDTVDKAVSRVFFENLEYLLKGRALDYVVVNHMEPDHCATLDELVIRYPSVKIVLNAKAAAMVKQFFTFDIDSRAVVVAEGDTLITGRHTFTFVMAPMVHWPETMVTYDTTDKILYSADAFGSFGAISGNIFSDEVRYEENWLDDARRYYTNIVGKYGNQVQALFKKAAKLDIAMICPLHGLIWRNHISWYIDKHQKWSTYTPEDPNSVMIAYGSIYGDTENAAQILASALADRGVKNIVMYDVSVTHPSEILSEAFRCSHLVFASATYNAGIFINMETALLDIKAHNLQNRTVALIENGTWAPASGSLMREILSSIKGTTILDPVVSLKSSVKEEQVSALEQLADVIVTSMPKPRPAALPKETKVDPDALFKISYGLYVLTASEGSKDNGCIINTVMQVTDIPKRITICVNKLNYTHDMIVNTGLFNLSVLTTEAPYQIFRHFGFQSGRDVDKFAGYEGTSRTDNGVIYLDGYCNAVISGKVISSQDFGTHTEFLAEITDSTILSDVPAVTYQYYFDHIKPKPQPASEKKKGFVCKVCGYVYEGETLPPDFVCPICKHGAEDFEPLES